MTEIYREVKELPVYYVELSKGEYLEYDGKPIEYNRGSAIRKARQFNGKIKMVFGVKHVVTTVITREV